MNSRVYSLRRRLFIFLFSSSVFCAAETPKDEPKPAFTQPIAEIKLSNGAVFRNVTIVRYERERVVLKTSGGIGNILYSYIPEPLRAQMLVERDAALAAKDVADKSTRIANAKIEEEQRQRDEAEKIRQAKFAEAIDHKSIMVGMTTEQVRRSWGSPGKINSSGGAYGSHEQWIYESNYVYFDDGKLTSWQSSR
jgi:hypothetical protein